MFSPAPGRKEARVVTWTRTMPPKHSAASFSYIHDPKLPLDGRIYMLTVGSVLTTNVSQISLCQLLFRATLKVRLDSCLSLLLRMDNFDCTKMNAHFKKFTACLREGLIHKWKQALLAPPLPIMLLNNSRLCSTHKPSSAFLYTAVLYQRYIAHSS